MTTAAVKIIPIQQVFPHLKMFNETAGAQPPKKPMGFVESICKCLKVFWKWLTRRG